MSKLLLSLLNGYFSFGNWEIFHDISFYLYEGDKICLVGKNGSGKSSLLKILAEDFYLDKGEIHTAKGVKIGYLPQDNLSDSEMTIYEYVLQDIQAEDENKKYLADMILSNLDLDGNRSLKNLSGGRLRRVSLTKALVGEPDILLLDEPTNHLDIAAIEWLQNYIISKPELALLCISHDREFLKKISNKIFWLDRGEFLIHNKGFEDFDNLVDIIAKQEEEKIRKLTKKLEDEEHWLAYGVTARRKRNQRRLKDLHTLRSKIKTDKGRFKTAGDAIRLPVLTEDQRSKLVVEMDSVTCGYDDVSPPKILFKDISLRIMQGEKIGIIGRNGAGKTSFIKTLLGMNRPLEGNVKIGVSVSISYADQKRELIDVNKTLWENLCPEGGDMVLVNGKPKHVAAYLKQFLFKPDQFKASASILSGGELNRLLLAKILATSGSFIILDEPTNDLDMDSLEMLEEILSEYKGTVLVVSHDRAFLDELVTRTIILDGNTLEDYVGGYTDYLNEKKLNHLPRKEKNSKNIIEEKPIENKKLTKLSYKDQRDLEILPVQIEELEQKIASHEKELEDPNLYSNSPDKFNFLTQEIINLKNQVNSLEERWLEVVELQENLNKL